MSSQNKISQLVDQLHSYSFKPRVKQDCLSLTSNIPSLFPQIGSIVQQDGTMKTILLLAGTIPMYFRGNKYNIPMKFCVPEMYPYHPPTCYVTPTQTMMIKQRHKYVDQNGLCYHPYLSQWDSKQSNLYELVNQLSAVFGSDPPVFEKKSHHNTSWVQQTVNPNMHNQQQIYQQQQVYQQQQYQQQQYQQQQYQQQQYQQYQQQQQQQVDYKKQLTSKVQQKLMELSKETGSQVDKLIEVQGTLGKRHQALMQAMKDLKDKKAQFEKGCETLKKKDESITKWLQENKGDIDIDKVIAAPDEQSEQILELSATDHTIEDMLYFLDKGFQKKLINSETYLDYIRELSTKQFMAKALLKKIALQS